MFSCNLLHYRSKDATFERVNLLPFLVEQVLWYTRNFMDIWRQKKRPDAAQRNPVPWTHSENFVVKLIG